MSLRTLWLSTATALLFTLGGCSDDGVTPEELEGVGSLDQALVTTRVQAENYARYYDTTAGNTGGGCVRGSDGVDLQTTTDTGGGCNVGWVSAGEWLEYDVSLPTSGSHSITLRLAAASSGKTFRVLVDNVAVGSVEAPASGWQAFADRTLSGVTLSAGSHVVRVISDTGSLNFNYIDLIGPDAAGSLPSPWTSADVGAVAASGSASYASSTFTVKGSGADIWNAADGFRFVYQSWSGDGQITARVASLQNTNAWAKAGVMFRESLATGSKHALMAVSATSGLAFQRRTSTGGTSEHTGSSGSAPRWLRLQRSGSTLTGQSSSDGSSWTTLGSATVSMTSSLYVGLAVTSHADGTLATVTFDNVSVGSLPVSSGSGIAGVVSEALFNAWFPNRNAFYTYAGLTSINSVYADFVNSSDATIRKREAAAFLANISWESDWLQAIKEYNTANYCNYCGACGCPAGTCNYYGRGPIQLSWDCNYKAAGQSIGKDLLNNPDLVSSDASVAWQTAGWFWNTQPGPGGYGSSAHAAMLASSGSGGFGATIAHINGSQECPSLGGSNTSARDARIARYKSFCDQLGVSYGSNLSC